MPNNNNFAFINVFSFFALKSLYPYVNFDAIFLGKISTRNWINKKKAIDIFIIAALLSTTNL